VPAEEIVADLRKSGWSEHDAWALIEPARSDLGGWRARMDDDSEKLTQAVRNELANGATRDDIVAEFVAVGWIEGVARDFVEAAELGERDAASSIHSRAAKRDLGFGIGALLLGMFMLTIAIVAGHVQVGIFGAILIALGVWQTYSGLVSLFRR
jgi:hypothetical protein